MAGPGALPRFWRSFSRFGVLGLVSFLLNLGLTVVLHEVAGAPEELAFAVALATVLAVNFLACRHLVFAAVDGDPRRQLVGFLLASLGFRGAEYAAFLIVHTWLGAPYVAAILGILAVSMLVKFFFYRTFIFRGAAAPAPADIPPDVPSSRAALHMAVLTVLAAAVYGNTLHNQLHLDDIYRIRDNAEVNRVWPILRHFVHPETSAALPQVQQYRPLLPLSVSLNHAASDALHLDRLTGLHLGNIALHAAVCAVLYLLFVELLALASGRGPPSDGQRDLAFVACLIFAVHPISAVPVNYVCSRDLLMMMLLLSGALLVYARMRRRDGDTVLGWTAAIVLFALSMLSKQNGVVAPLLVLLLEWLVVPARGWRDRLRRLWRPLPFVAVVAGFFAWTELYLHFSDLDKLHTEALSPRVYARTMAKVHLLYYLRNFVWPFLMRPLPLIDPAREPWEPGVLAGGAFIAATLAAALLLWRRAPLASFCILAYWVLFAPTSSIRPFRYLATDYRQYPSLAFLCLGLVLVGLRPGWRRPTMAAGLVAAALFGAVTVLHTNAVWRTDESLWAQSVRYGGATQAHVNYALSVQSRDPALALRHYEEALGREPYHVYANVDCGLLLIGMGRQQEGLDHVRRAVSVWPNSGFTHYWLSEALRRTGDLAGARSESRRAADLNPKYVRYQYQAGLDLQSAGDVAGSLPYLERAVAGEPDYLDARFLYGFALQSAGRWPEAEGCYRDFLERRPDHVQARFNLAHGLMRSGQPREAIEHFTRVLELDPQRRSTHYWLAECYRAVGDEAAAARESAAYEGREGTDGPRDRGTEGPRDRGTEGLRD